MAEDLVDGRQLEGLSRDDTHELLGTPLGSFTVEEFEASEYGDDEGLRAEFRELFEDRGSPAENETWSLGPDWRSLLQQEDAYLEVFYDSEGTVLLALISVH